MLFASLKLVSVIYSFPLLKSNFMTRCLIFLTLANACYMIPFKIVNFQFLSPSGVFYKFREGRNYVHVYISPFVLS